MNSNLQIKKWKPNGWKKESDRLILLIADTFLRDDFFSQILSDPLNL